MGYWSNCVDDSHCQRPFNCRNNRCVCPVGRLWNEPFCENFTNYNCDTYSTLDEFKCRESDDNRICDGKSKQCICRDQTVEDLKDRFCKFVHTQCKSEVDCQVNDENSICNLADGQCKCLSNFYYDFNVKLCQQKLNYYNECQYHYQCNGVMLCQRFLGKSLGRCRCLIGWLWSEIENVCQPTAVTVNCSVDKECRNSKICINGTCQCPTGYRLDSYGKCTRGASRRSDCNLNSDCRANMTCDYTSLVDRGSCACDYGYQWSNRPQKCLLFNETLCYLEWDCKDKEVFLNCTDHKCTCEGNRELSKDGVCLLEMPACRNNTECLSDSTETTSNSIFCNQDLKKNQCTCKQNTYVSKYKCLYRRCNSEHPCHSDDYSNDDNMHCLDRGYCECKYGVDQTGRCKNKSNNSILGSSPAVFYIVIQSSLFLMFIL